MRRAKQVEHATISCCFASGICQLRVKVLHLTPSFLSPFRQPFHSLRKPMDTCLWQILACRDRKPYPLRNVTSVQVDGLIGLQAEAINHAKE